jgi:hypothetical protein
VAAASLTGKDRPAQQNSAKLAQTSAIWRER